MRQRATLTTIPPGNLPIRTRCRPHYGDLTTMSLPPESKPAKSRRLLVLSVMLGTIVPLTLIAIWQSLPMLAPQFFITNSPWIWPIIRAEAYETEGKDPEPSNSPAPSKERNSLRHRLEEECGWMDAAIPLLTNALGHPDLRMRRTAASTLLSIQFNETPDEKNPLVYRRSPH